MTHSPSAERTERIQQVLEECIDRRARGEVISDEALFAAHPELMPELGEALRDLHFVQQAQQEAEHSGSAGLHVRCPHCHHPIEIVDDTSLSEVVCPSCGSGFSLTDDSEQTFQASQQEMVNHFQLLDRVGVGAFGSVWSARDTQLDRVVALKIPRKGELSPEEAEQFIREARAAAQLKHPHIVSVLEVGRYKDRIYIACDFIQGLDLADWLTDHQATPREAAELCVTVADALDHAHRHGVIHRDLKPSNIMLDAEGEPHLMDFGLAKRDAGEMTMTVDGKLLGTPAYMSPEQARGAAHQADARSDVYSLGVILFELLTGERPFRGNTRMLLHQVLVEDAPSPRKLNSAVPRDLETICLKCMEKDPHRRYQSAGELQDDLRRFLGGHAVNAHPISRLQRVWRTCKRKPLVTGLTTVVAMLLLFLSIAGPAVAVRQRILARRAADAYSVAQSARSKAESEAQRFHRLLYSSDMSTAQSDWVAGDVESVLNLLERHYPKPGEEDLRGFEWYHLWRNCQRYIMAPRLPTGELAWDVQFAADGDTVTTVSTSEGYVNVQRWDAVTQVELARTSLALSGVGHQKLSPDGSVAAIGHVDGRISLLNLATGTTQDLDGLEGEVTSISFSRDGRVLAAGTRGGTVKAWNLKNLHAVAEVKPQQGVVWCVAVSPNGRLLAYADEDRKVALLDLPTGDLVGVLTHAAPVWSAAFSPDGKYLCVGTSGEHVAVIWSVEDSQIVREFTGHDRFVTAVAFSPDGKTLATASGDRRIRLWDVQNGEMIESLVGNATFVRAMAFSPDGSILACRSETPDVRLWPLRTIPGVSTLTGHRENVHSVRFSSDGKTLASASMDATIILWDADTGAMNARLSGHESDIWALAVSPLDDVLASGSDDKTMKLWDMKSGSLLDTLFHDSEVRAIDFSPTGQLLAAGERSGKVTIWSMTSRQPIATVNAYPNQVSSLIFSRDGKTLTTGCREWSSPTEDKNVKQWHVPSLSLKSEIASEFPVGIMAYTSDERFLAFGGDGLTVRDMTRGTQISGIPRGTSVRSSALAFFPDGETLLSAAMGVNGVKFWDLGTRQLRFRLTAHRDWINSVCISADGRMLVTASSDDTLKIWRAASDEEVEVMRRRWLSAAQ